MPYYREIDVNITKVTIEPHVAMPSLMDEAAPNMPKTDSLDKIEITSAMTEAGVFAAREYYFGSPLGDLVDAVYVAMVTAAHLNTDPLRLNYQPF